MGDFVRTKLVKGAYGVDGGEISDTNPLPVTLSGTGGASPSSPNLVSESSIFANTGGTSQAVSISSVSAQSSAITDGFAVVTPTTDCFFRAGANPTALSNGTDQILLGGNTYRITNITSGHKLAFITTSATGTVYITPGA
jgi:hypothetical protein